MANTYLRLGPDTNNTSGGSGTNVNVHDGAGNPITSVVAGPVRSLDVNVTSGTTGHVIIDNASIDVNLTAPSDNVAISDGTDTLAVNADGSINVVTTIGGTVTVQATNLDIRDLVFATDKVDASGSSVSVTNFPATQAVSAVALPLPTGASTETTLSALNTKVPANLTVTATRLLVDGSGVTQPVSVSSLPLPTGAATEASLAGLLTTTAFQARINTLGQKVAASSTPVVLASDQTSIPVTDNGSSLTVDSAQLPAALVGGRLSVDGSGVTQPISASALPLPSGAATEATLATVASAIKAEDSVAGSTDPGIKVLGVREDTVTINTSASGDYTCVKTDRYGRQRVVTADSDVLPLGVYYQTAGTLVVQAAADAATGGRCWLINPVGSAVTVRVRRVIFRSQLGSALAATTSPRLSLERVTFTGTASGATVAGAKRRTADATQVSSIRLASTGLTLTAGAPITEFLPVAAATAVAYNTPAEAIFQPDNGDLCLLLGAGEGLVLRQADAGTAADTRRNTVTFIIEEF